MAVILLAGMVATGAGEAKTVRNGKERNAMMKNRI